MQVHAISYRDLSVPKNAVYEIYERTLIVNLSYTWTFFYSILIKPMKSGACVGDMLGVSMISVLGFTMISVLGFSMISVLGFSMPVMQPSCLTN